MCLSFSTRYLFDDDPSCDVDFGVEPHHQMIGSNRANAFCFLSSLPLLPPATTCLAPICHPSSLNLHCIAGAGLSIYIIVIGERGFMGAKKKTSVLLLV
jgi:hypothetical protein